MEAQMDKAIDYNEELRSYYEALDNTGKREMIKLFTIASTKSNGLQWAYFVMKQLGSRDFISNWRLIINCEGFKQDVEAKCKQDTEARKNFLLEKILEIFRQWRNSPNREFDEHHTKFTWTPEDLAPLSNFTDAQINDAIDQILSERPGWDFPYVNREKTSE